MFVPSLSWQNDRFYIKMAQKCRFLAGMRPNASTGNPGRTYKFLDEAKVEPVFRFGHGASVSPLFTQGRLRICVAYRGKILPSITRACACAWMRAVHELLHHTLARTDGTACAGRGVRLVCPSRKHRRAGGRRRRRVLRQGDEASSGRRAAASLRL
jgi:hypothetical protein|eukprot:COSAG06_NODE_3586_length_5147_cov_6.618661_2_plen_156_part_00